MVYIFLGSYSEVINFQVSLLVYDENEKVIQVKKERSLTVTRGSSITVELMIDDQGAAKQMGIMVKPVPMF